MTPARVASGSQVLSFALALAVVLGCASSDPGKGGGRGGSDGGGGEPGSGGSGGSGGTTTGGTGGSNSTGGAGGGGGGSGGAGGGGAGGTATTPDASADGGDARAGDGPGPGTDAAGGDRPPVDSGGTPFDAGALAECMTPSIDRFQRWLAHSNVGAGGNASLLVKSGERYVARMQFVGGGVWSEVVIELANDATTAIDLSTSAGFAITYSATADLWLQVRGTVQRNGGAQHVVKLPATGGRVETHTYPFTADAWTWHPLLGRPMVAFDAVVKSALIFNLVGNITNTVEISGLRVAGHVPPCR